MRVRRQTSQAASIVVFSAVTLGCADRGILEPPGPRFRDRVSIAASASLLPLSEFGIAPVGGQPCSSAPYRDFDFWVGNWDVHFGSTSTLAGTNQVTSKLGGCMVEENWRGAFGGRGRSINAYDQGTDTWSQMWVATGGCPFSVILIEGRFANGSMTMSGSRPQPEGFLIAPPCGPPPGTVVFTRTDLIRWTLLPSGSVLQQFASANNDNPLPALPDPPSLIGLRYDPVSTVTPLPEPPRPSFCPTRVAAQHFNFMIGVWKVHQGEGNGAQGTASFSKDLTDCLIEEHFQALGGYEGISYNTFDVFTQRWTRTYVDNQGQRLFMTGGLVGNAMVLTGTKRTTNGQDVMVRLTWARVTADEVRQTWEFSRDGGTSWIGERVLRYTRDG